LELKVWGEGSEEIRPLAARVLDLDTNPNEIKAKLGGDLTVGPLLECWCARSWANKFQ
jgi:hypothetical protein